LETDKRNPENNVEQRIDAVNQRAKQQLRSGAKLLTLKRYWKIYKAYFTPEFLKQAKKYRHLKKLLANEVHLLSQDHIHIARVNFLSESLKASALHGLQSPSAHFFNLRRMCRARKCQPLVGCAPDLCRSLGEKT